MSKGTWTCLSLALVALTVVGCGPSTAGQKRTFPVTGTVTLNGAPVAGATVTFSPAKPGNPAAFGKTDDTGAYSLMTYSAGDGAVAGDYKVTVMKSGGGGGSAPAAGSHEDYVAGGGAPPSHQSQRGGASGAGADSLLPAKYASAEQTPLQYSVKEEPNEYNIQLEP